MILMVDFKKVKPPNIGDMFDKSVEQWSISEKLHLASEYRKLQCDNKAFMKIIYKHVDPLGCNEDEATTVDMINLIINTYG